MGYEREWGFKERSVVKKKHIFRDNNFFGSGIITPIGFSFVIKVEMSMG